MSYSCLLRSKRRSFTLAALALAASLLSSAAWAAQGTLGFDEAVSQAAELAPMLTARQADITAAREEAARAAALPDPRLTVGIENWPVTGPDAFSLSTDDMTMKRVGLMQEFPARAKRQARQTLADRTVDQAQALTQAERLEVQEEAAQAWLALWAARQELDALQVLREQSDLAVRVAKARLGGGTGSAVDVMATQSAALELENRVEAAETALGGARARLARWLGVTPEQLPEPGAPPDIKALPHSEAELLSSVDRQRSLLEWRAREAVAEAEVALATAEKRPDWSVAAAYGQRDGSRSDMLMVEFSIDLPLFTRNRQDRGITARRAELQSVAASREDARRAQLAAVHRALAEWHGLKKQLERTEKQILPLARDRAQTAVAAYRGGGELQPWLEARRDEIEQRIERARTLGELGRVWAALAFLLPREEIAP